MAYNKHTWTTQELITSDKLNNIESNAYSNNSLVNFVNKYGADNTGINSVSNLLQTALEETSLLGLQLYIPAGTYKLDSTITLVDNMTLLLSSSAKMVRYHTTGYTFHAKNGAGVGTGGKNIKISGGIWDTSDGFSNPHGLSLMHIENAIFENMEVHNAVSSGHLFDIMGSKNVTIKHNKFYGSNSVADRFYSEIIQLDESSAIGSSYTYSDDTYDGIADENINIIGNKVLPNIENNEIINYSAPLVGMHAQVENSKHKNIFIDGNYIQDTMPLPTTNSPLNYGSVHIRNVDGIKISNNIFKQTNVTDFPNIAINVIIGEVYLKFEDVATNNPTFVSGAFEDVNNVDISNNTFSGFQFNTLPAGGTPSIIRINGSSTYSKYINNVHVHSNVFSYNVKSGDENKYSNTVFNAISVNYVNNLKHNSNAFYNTNSFGSFSNIKSLNVSGNNAQQLSNTIASLNNIDGIFSNNTVNGTHGNINVSNSRLVMVGNNIYNWSPHTGTIVYRSIVSLNDPEIVMSNNRFIMNDTNYSAIYINPTSSKNKVISNNILSGINSDKPTNIVYVNNIDTKAN